MAGVRLHVAAVKKIFAGYLVGWLVVTLIYTFSVFIESGSFHWGTIAAVGFVTGIYTLSLGIPAFLLFKGIGLSGLAAFICTGLVASSPILLYSLYQNEFGYSVSTVIAGASFGAIFAAIYEAKPKQRTK